MKQLPVVEGHWFWKSSLDITRGMLPFTARVAKEYGSIVMARTLLVNLILVTEPEYVKYVLQENNKNYLKSEGYKTLKLFLGEGLLTSEGDFWRSQRRLAQPAFHRKKLELLAQDMSEEAGKMADEWAELSKTGAFTVNISEEMSRVTMRIVARALFGNEIDAMIEQVAESVTLLNEAGIHRILHPLTSLPLWVPSGRNREFKKHAARLDEMIYGFISDRRANPSDRHDLLQLLLDAKDEDTGEGMSDQQLRDEVMTLFVAGHETTTMAMSWTFFLLAKNPNIWETLKSEIDGAIGKGVPGMADLPNLPYTRQVIDEAMRLYPPAWLIGRKAIQDDTVGGYPIKANSNVLLSTYLIHRREDIWPEPERFDPDRFAPGKLKTKHRYAYFPFGGGPRLCIGNNFALMEMQLILAALAGKYKPFLAQDFEPVKEPFITLRPQNGIQIRLEPQD